MDLQTPDLRKIVVGAIANAANRSPDELHDDVELLDLGLDSLDFARILIDIEDDVGAEVPPYILERLMEERAESIRLRDVLEFLSRWDPSQTGVDLGPWDEVLVIDGEDRD